MNLVWRNEVTRTWLKDYTHRFINQNSVTVNFKWNREIVKSNSKEYSVSNSKKYSETCKVK